MKLQSIVLLFILLTCSFGNAQSKFPNEWVSNNNAFGMGFGISNFDLGSTRSDLVAEYPEIFSPILFYYGITASPILNINRKYLVDSHIDLMFYDNHGNTSDDPVQFSWSGWYFGLDAGIDLFRKQDRFDLITAIGLNMGRFKLTQESELEEIRINTNPFIAPKIVIEPRLFIGDRFCISVKSELMVDLSNPLWKIKNNGVNNLSATEATGFNILFTLAANMGRSRIE